MNVTIVVEAYGRIEAPVEVAVMRSTYKGEVEVETNDVPFQYKSVLGTANEDALVPPRATDNVPVQDGENVCVSPLEVIERSMLVSEVVASVWVAPVWNDEYCAPRPLMPVPDPPASTPQEKRPFSQSNLSLEPEQAERPAPYT